MVRVFPGLFLAASALSLAACQQSGGEPRDAAAGFMAEAQRPAYSLHYVDAGETIKLAYGLPQSEVMSLMLECAKGQGSVEISDNAHGAETIALRSGGTVTTFRGHIAPAPIAPIVVANARIDAPALAAFRRTGEVEVANGDERYAIRASGVEKVGVELFFDACATSV